MKKHKIFKILFFSLLLSFSFCARASDNVLIENFEIKSVGAGLFKASFELTATGYIQPDVRYFLSIYEEGVDGKKLVAQKIFEDEITLFPKEKITKEISYNYPDYFSGRYNAQILFGNRFGHSFGSANSGEFMIKKFYELPEGEAFSRVEVERCELLEPKQFLVGEDVSIKCILNNPIDKKVDVLPELSIFKNSFFGEKILTQNNTSEGFLVSLAPKEKDKELFFNFQIDGERNNLVKISFFNTENGREASYPEILSIKTDNNPSILKNVFLKKKDAILPGNNLEVELLFKYPVSISDFVSLSVELKDGIGEICSKNAKDISPEEVNGGSVVAELPGFLYCDDSVLEISLLEKDQGVFSFKERFLLGDLGISSVSGSDKSSLERPSALFYSVFLFLIFISIIFFLVKKYISKKV